MKGFKNFNRPKKFIIFVAIVAAILPLYTPYKLKTIYETNVARTFMDAAISKAKESKTLSLRDVTKFDWDKVCFLYIEDTSFASITTKDFIEYKDLQFGHWTQKLPHPSILNWLRRNDPGGKLYLFYNHEYGEAFVFIKGKTATVVKPNLARTGYFFSARYRSINEHWYSGECRENMDIVFEREFLYGQNWNNLYVVKR